MLLFLVPKVDIIMRVFYRLDDEAKEMFVKLGSSHSKELAFRDNWVFVGGPSMKNPSRYEQVGGVCCFDVVVIIELTAYSPSCYGWKTVKGPFGLRFKLPLTHLSTTYGRGGQVPLLMPSV